MPGFNSYEKNEELTKPSLHLRRNEGFAWKKLIAPQMSVWAKGYLFDAENRLYDGETLCGYFARVNTESEFANLLLAANGSFAVVLQKADLTLVAVDRLRSIPLFYTSGDATRLVGDDADALANIIGKTLPDITSLQEFALAGFVLGRDTLHPQIKEIQAGEYVRLEQTGSTPVRYYRHLHTHDRYATEEEHFAALAGISRQVAKRLICSVHDRPIILPLSGGYDSRYIACMLKEMKYENVICYTYGRSDSHEVAASRQVAASLGYDWHFVEYTDAKVKKVLSSPQYEAYCNYCHNYSSLPHIQEFIALTELRSMGTLPDDGVIVPGFCGDLLGGSYVPGQFQIGYEDALLKTGLVEHIADKHLFIKLFNNDLVTTKVRAHIQQVLDEIGAVPDTPANFVSYNEAFFTAHKVAKFVVNSLRVYEFFGLEWRMPLWDQELIDYWYSVPVGERIGGRLYNNFLFHNYFEPMNVAIYKELGVNRVAKAYRLLRRFRVSYEFASAVLLTAHKWRNQFRRSKPNINAFDEWERFYTVQLYTAGMPLSHAHDVNGIFARWWLWGKYDWAPALRPIKESKLP